MKGYIGQQASSHAARLAVIRYAGALIALAVGVLLALGLQSVLDASVVLLMAILVAAWFSGFWPALCASVLASLALDYFFTPPLYTLTLEIAHIPRLLVFTGIASLFVSISAGRRRAERLLKEGRDELDAKVRERTADLAGATQRFEDLVNSIEGIVWEADARTFQFSFVSRQAERVLGYPAAQWLEEPTFWRDHIHPEDRDAAVNACISATAQKRDHDFEYRMVASDGGIVWLRDLVSVVVEHNEATRLRGVMIDITARKQAEDALREQANLLDLTHDTIFVRDMNDVIRYWNRGAEGLYGWTSREAVGQVTHALMQTIFPAPLETINAELLDRGRWEGELVHSTRDGSQVVVASRWSLQRDVDGRPVAILETNNDITERKRAEDGLRASEEQWKAVFENNPTMYFMIDGQGTVLSVNPFGADQLGYTIDELIGQSVLKMFAEAEWGVVRETIQRCLERLGESMSWEIRKVRRDGTPVWVRETAKAMRRIDGSSVVLIACEDITPRKRAEQELEELAGRLIYAQEQERSRIGRELHDHISQMLGVLTIRMDQLRADEATPPAVAAALGELRGNMVEITGDIHGLSHRLHSSTLDYLGLVPALQKLVNEFSTRHGIDIAFEPGELPTPVPSDVALCLFRITEESLTNIAKHSDAKSARVQVNGTSSGLVLTIEDSGKGFDPQRLERGAGLGFVSMRERLRVLRGTVRVDSAHSRGTRIEALVPVASVLAAMDGREELEAGGY